MPPMTLKLRSNERTFFCGKTGSGKTYAAKYILKPYDRLVVFDLAVLYDNPVGENTPRRLMEAKTALLSLWEYWLVEGGHITLGKVIDQQLPLVLQALVKADTPDCPGSMTSNG